MPPRNAGALRAATLVMNGDSRLCATAKTMAARTNPVAVTGHLAAGDVGGDGPDPWRLSSDRAQLARVFLEAVGVADARVSRVTGKSDRSPAADDPRDQRNRRVEITLLRRFEP